MAELGVAKKKTMNAKVRNSMSEKARTDEQEVARKEVLKHEMVMISLPPTGDARPISIVSDGVAHEYMSEGDPENVTINGYVYHVPRGVMVEVPAGVAEILKNQKSTQQYFSQELKRNFVNGNKSQPQSFEN